MTWAISHKGYSQRRACRLVGLDPKTYRYRARRGDDAPLRQRLRDLASQRRRFGYRRLHILIKREGVSVNHKKLYRLYREERFDRLGCHDNMAVIVEILKDRAGAMATIVAQQLDSRCKFKQLYFLIQDLVLEHPHNLESGVIRTGDQPRLRTPPTLLHVQITVGLAVEEDTQLDQPFCNRRPLFDHDL